jgi:two-component system nitrate/nitrite response regulator NarL
MTAVTTTATTRDLTPRERSILDLVGDGLPNRRIGERLGLAEKTVKNHVSHILAKLGVSNRTEAALKARGLRP